MSNDFRQAYIKEWGDQLGRDCAGGYGFADWAREYLAEKHKNEIHKFKEIIQDHRLDKEALGYKIDDLTERLTNLRKNSSRTLWYYIDRLTAFKKNSRMKYSCHAIDGREPMNEACGGCDGCIELQMFHIMDTQAAQLKEACTIMVTDNRPVAAAFEEKYPHLFKGLI